MKNRLASTLGIALMTVIISVGLMGTTCAQVTSENSCSRIKAVVCDDLMKQGQLSCDSAVLFLPARDNNQAFQQAQNLCIRLGAEMMEKDGCSTTYELSDRTGKITIIDLKKDSNVYAILYLKINCYGLKIKEIRFITLKAYADLQKSERERRQQFNNYRK